MKVSDQKFRSFSMLFFTFQIGRQKDNMMKKIPGFKLSLKPWNNFYYYYVNDYNRI